MFINDVPFSSDWKRHESKCIVCGKTFMKLGPVDENGKGLYPGGTCLDCQKKAEREYRQGISDSYKAMQISYELEEAGVPGSNIGNRFSNFTPLTDTQRRALASASSFLDSGASLLSFIGECGRGKTHLAVAVLAEFCARRLREEHRKSSAYITEGRLIDEFRAGMNRSAKSKELSESQVMEKYEEFGLLIIDEMGRNNDSAYTIQKIQDLLQVRIQNPTVKTIICGNMSAEKFREHLGDAVRSRLNEVDSVGRKATLFFMDGEDYRSKKASAS